MTTSSQKKSFRCKVRDAWDSIWAKPVVAMLSIIGVLVIALIVVFSLVVANQRTIIRNAAAAPVATVIEEKITDGLTIIIPPAPAATFILQGQPPVATTPAAPPPTSAPIVVSHTTVPQVQAYLLELWPQGLDGIALVASLNDRFGDINARLDETPGSTPYIVVTVEGHEYYRNKTSLVFWR
jgi:hypothetical protein